MYQEDNMFDSNRDYGDENDYEFLLDDPDEDFFLDPEFLLWIDEDEEIDDEFLEEEE